MKHLSPKEIDELQKMRLKGVTLKKCQAFLSRRRRGPAPSEASCSRALRGLTYKRGGVERRGRPTKITPQKLVTLNRVRKQMQKKNQNSREITLGMLAKSARVKVHRTTVARKLKTIGVCWRRPRTKPQRTLQQKQARHKWAKQNAGHTAAHWKKCIFIDCKKFDAALTLAQQLRYNQNKVRGVLRHRNEGLQSHLTKACQRKHRANGPPAHVFAAVAGGQIKVWEYIQGRWNAAEAVRCYAILAKTLQRQQHPKPWFLVEDNDPAGFKSKAGVAQKESLRFKVQSLPPYSPDAMPLDYSLWKTVQDKANAKVEGERVTIKQYRAILQRTALRLPRATVEKAVCSMTARAKAILKAKGGDISMD